MRSIKNILENRAYQADNHTISNHDPLLGALDDHFCQLEDEIEDLNNLIKGMKKKEKELVEIIEEFVNVYDKQLIENSPLLLNKALSVL